MVVVLGEITSTSYWARHIHNILVCVLFGPDRTWLIFQQQTSKNQKGTIRTKQHISLGNAVSV